ncbi:metallophosphoesterase family protein [Candidatus Sumerlaeota bacterium]|nr:metallophosphoesterase family protein [Candidatus Sumerlaeota bacterium]
MNHSRMFFAAVCVWVVSSGAPARAELTRKPYLQNVQKTSAVIMWESDVEGEGTVRYGRTLRMERAADARRVQLEPSSLRRRVEDEFVTEIHLPPDNAFVYEAYLTDLEPGEIVFYQVEHAGGVFGRRHFRTTPLETDRFRFVAYGDNRTQINVAASVADQILIANPDFFISTGDLVSRGQIYEQWTEQFFGPIQDVIDHIPIWPSMGNHEGDGVNFRNLLNLPGEEDFYSFDYGNAHFVAINSIHETPSRMAEFLEEDLAKSDARWKFVYYHYPTFNAGGHRSRWGRTQLPEIYARHHVDIVFNGHSHLYERTRPITVGEAGGGWPVTYIVTGGAGAPLYDLGDTAYIAKDAKVHHITIIDIDGDRLSGMAVDEHGEVIDTFEIDKTQGHTAEYRASAVDMAQIDFADALRTALQRGAPPIIAGQPLELNITIKNSALDGLAEVTLRPQDNEFIDAIEPPWLSFALGPNEEVTATFAVTPNISFTAPDAETRSKVERMIDTGRLANLRDPPLMMMEVQYETPSGGGRFTSPTLLLRAQ